jgi:hypothetical protein
VRKVEQKKTCKLLVEFELDRKVKNYKSKQENKRTEFEIRAINQLTLLESSHTSLSV